jgi:hypothetical protein
VGRGVRPRRDFRRACRVGRGVRPPRRDGVVEVACPVARGRPPPPPPTATPDPVPGEDPTGASRVRR